MHAMHNCTQLTYATGYMYVLHCATIAQEVHMEGYKTTQAANTSMRHHTDHVGGETWRKPGIPK